MIVVRNGKLRGLAALRALMPYGAGTVYNTDTGRYEVVGQPGSYGTVRDLEAARYAAEITALAEQQPTPTSVMIGPYATYPVGMVRTLPNGVQIPEATYQQAIAEGRLEEVVRYYTSLAATSAPQTMPADSIRRTPTFTRQPPQTTNQVATYQPRVSLTNLSRPGQSPQVGDWLRVEITGGPPGQPLTATAIHNGDTSTSQLGTTNSAGAWSKDVQMSTAEIGHWVEHWRVGNTPATPTITFDVSAVVPTPPPTSQPQTPSAETPATPTTGGESPGAAAGAAGICEQIKTTAQKVPWWGWLAAAAGLFLFKRS